MVKKNKVLIIAALKNEINPVKGELKKYHSKIIDLDFLVTGIGREKTINNLTSYIQKHNTDTIVNIGSCGSLSEKIEIGEILFPVEFYTNSDDNQEKIQIDKINTKEAQNRFKTSKIYTASEPVASKTQKISIRSTYDVDIVDMESYWIAKFCQEKNIDFFSVKVVSDFAEGISIQEFKQQMSKIAGNLVKPVNSILELVEENGKRS